MAYFDVEMQKQEHEFNLRTDDMCSEVLSHKLKVTYFMTNLYCSECFCVSVLH